MMAALGIERATVVGQSLGGGVAMQLAYQHPELCERLVLVGSGGLGREVNWILRMLTLPGAEILMSVVFPGFVRDYGNRLSLFLRDRGVRAPHLVEMWRAYTSLVESDTRRAFLRTLRAVVDSGGQAVSATDRLYLAAHMPTLIVWGDRDDIIPVAHAHAAHAHIPGSRLEIFAGAGHFVHAEQPERFAHVLHDFIESSEPAPPDIEAYRERLISGSA
jgi:pimeloyl-ACP methyl ester carboxylesterase